MKNTLKAIVGFGLIVVMFTLAACSNQSATDYSRYEKIPLNAS